MKRKIKAKIIYFQWNIFYYISHKKSNCSTISYTKTFYKLLNTFCATFFNDKKKLFLRNELNKTKTSNNYFGESLSTQCFNLFKL